MITYSVAGRCCTLLPNITASGNLLVSLFCTEICARSRCSLIMETLSSSPGSTDGRICSTLWTNLLSPS
eukprot:1803012-Prorocentrum_lima.AAC.1